ncbi:hypothetical protein LTS18_004213 [Coniosporium uncinatum]|uniref:Uncharacterized protein n=1 Tax=Coniosporium uncinatum TaxID=93489 RepID=A0ACC3DSP1_9PEZI|nr:hypothetical protein LTS18_004213 [Coniosporium uncinatum]
MVPPDADDSEDDEDRSDRNAPNFLDRDFAFNVARTFHSTAKQAFAVSGWNPTKTWEGLNWNSSTTEGFCSGAINWTKHEIQTPNYTGFQIRRAKLTSIKDPKKNTSKRIIDFKTPHEPGDLSVDVQVLQEDLPGLAANSIYYMVIEICTSGPHPRAWARLPRLQVFDDQDAAQKVAIKVEYFDTKKKAWVHHYVHATYVFTASPVPDNVPEADGYLNAYWKAVGIYNVAFGLYFPNPRPWYKRYSNLEILALEYKHVEQEIHFKMQPRSPIPRLQRLPLDRVGKTMSDAGAKNVGKPFPRAVGEKRSSKDAGGKQNRCDSCYLNQLGHRSTKQRLHDLAAHKTGRVMSGTFDVRNKGLDPGCDRAENTDQCTNCRLLGRPCSWTDLESLRENEELQELLMWQTEKPGGETVPVPEFQSLRLA